MKIKYMEEAIKEAIKAYNEDEVPIGAVVVYEGKIIGKAHNIKEKSKLVTGHAELLAIEQACDYLNSWHLNDCDLYTTLEPCLMCTGAIIQSRINKVYCATKSLKYGELDNINDIYSKKMNIEYGLLENESKKILKNFFEEKRK